MDIKETVKIDLEELVNWHEEYESFMDILQEKVEEKIGRELSFWQVVCYSIVNHEESAVFFEVEGYEEK